MVIRTLDADYGSFFALRKNGDPNAHPPGFKGKDHFTTMMYNQSGFTIREQEISLSHKYNKVPLVFELLRKYDKVYQVNVYQKKDKYYLGIVHEVPEKPYVDNGLYQAIDLGVTKTAQLPLTCGISVGVYVFLSSNCCIVLLMPPCQPVAHIPHGTCPHL